MTGLTPEYLAYLREVADGAIPGPWDYMTNRVGDSPLIVTIYTDDPDDPTLIKPLICFESSTENLPDAQFIAAARTAVPELLDEIERLRRLLAELTDPDPCWFDHNGGCQAHGYLTLRPGETCPQYDAQQIRAALVADEQAQPDPAAEDWWDQDRQVPR